MEVELQTTAHMTMFFLCALAYLFGALSALVLVGLLSVSKRKQ